MKYRSEIDGLRAIAIIPVILFHAGFETFSGGFVGVDIFFVISGYLITSIIIHETKQGKFCLARFYERRARRILAPLFLVLFTSMVAAWILYLPDEMKIFSQTVASSATFLTNVYFYLKTNSYFGLSSELNPLLHLWSLSVEEQYYVFFPLLMIGLLRFKNHITSIVFIILMILSFGLSLWAVDNSPVFNFFLLPARGWELLIGALLATSIIRLDEKKGSQLLSITGLLLIILSILSFNKSTPFPSHYALLPTLGTALIIIYAKSGTIVHYLLSKKLMVGIGLISYSAYLWHQPLFAFSRTLGFDVKNYSVFFSLTSMTLILAFATRVLVETPIRSAAFLSRKIIFVSSISFTFLFTLFGIIGHMNSGYPLRNEVFSRLVSNVGLSLKCNGNTEVSPICSTSNEPKVAIYGNSFAMHLVDGFIDSFPEIGIVQLTQDSCEPFKAIKKKKLGKKSCALFNQKSLHTILTTPSIKVVIISSPFSSIISSPSMDDFNNVIRLLEKEEKQVIIIGPTPTNKEDHGKCFARNHADNQVEKCNFPRADIFPSYHKIMKQLRLVEQNTNVTLIELTDIICNKSTCNIIDDQVLIFRDTHHLSREGSRFIFDKIKHLIKL